MGSDKKIVASLPPVPQPPPPPSLNGASNAFPRVRPVHGRTTGPTRRSTRGQWTTEEDEILRKAVQRYKGKNWKKIAECFKDRTDVQCLHRWQKVLNPELIKGPWSKEEDETIIQLVNKYGPKKWSTIAQHLPGRIGKQCRERWHNHLNPSINKEAWTQEEELVLIRAHQIHGNRWAELTKYLPGRTDNSIKNHWNSSVKKKLDSYIASGLLAQFQGLPVVSLQNQSIPATSLRVQQSSEDGSVFIDGAEAEEISECSQVGCSQTASDLSNTACRTKEDFLLSEESDHGKVQDTSPTESCSEQYYTSVENIIFTIPDIPYEFSCSSKYFEDSFAKDCGSCTPGDSNYGALGLPNISSLKLATDSSNLSGNYFLPDANHDAVPGPSHQCIDYSTAPSVNNLVVDSDVSGQKPKTEEGCSELILRQDMDEGCPPANLAICPDIIDMDGYEDFASFQSFHQFSEKSGIIALRPHNHLNTPVEASNCVDLSSVPSEVSVENHLMLSAKVPNQINDSLAASHAQKVVADVDKGLVPAYNNSGPFHDHIEQTEPKESTRLIPVNTFGSETSDNQQTPPVVEQPVNPTCGQEVGTLCYEPPRFPSLDIPFLSCDLVQSGNDVQQEFSPLGIRQLMMSSMNSLTPFKLWDSPSSDGSPDAVLKSAAKTFACTPSILKKRHRDLLSPLSPFSERRYDKKTGKDVKQGFLCTSRLTTEFSRLDVMFDGTDHCKESASPSNDQNECASTEDKENICPAFEGQGEEAKYNRGESVDTPSEDQANKKDFKDMEKEGNLELHSEKSVHYDCTFETPRGVLVERHLSDTQSSSPDGVISNAGLETGGRGSEAYSLKNVSKQVAVSESAAGKTKSIVSPPPLEKKQSDDYAISSSQPVSTVMSAMIDSLVNEVGAENLNIFGGTPFRRSIESPSAWKSPWYFSSLVPCPRFDADLMIEEMGIFMSPGERSFDAIGLMKQINEQNADAYADARKVLGSETPESLLRQRCLKTQNSEQESNTVVDNQHEGRLRLASNVSTERRVLDFSECGTPAKAMEKGKCVNAASFSSPSCLLKSFR